MKLFGLDIKTKEKGYFGVRRCNECNNELRDVNLIEISGVERMFFIPIKKHKAKQYLVCSKCGASLELSDDLTHLYKTYKRFDKPTTDEVVQTLRQIDTSLTEQDLNIKCRDRESVGALNLIYEQLAKKFGNPDYLEELISVYFSKD